MTKTSNLVVPPGILYVDRTGIETDWECGMKYWWNRLEGERGIVPVSEADYFIEGRELHNGLEKIAQGVPYQDVVASIPVGETQIEMETYQRRKAWFIIFGKWIWPQWKADYEIALIEKELILDRTPLWIAVKPDLVLRGVSKSLGDLYGKLIYKEYKTTGSKSAQWIAHWPYAIQVHIGLQAAAEELGEEIAHGTIVGLDKGYVSYGRLNHPTVWAYRSGDLWQSKYRYGWDHAPVWDFEPGLESWLETLGEDRCREQFCASQPIYLNPRMLDNLIRRQTVRQEEIRNNKEACRTDWDARVVHFEQRFKSCKPAWGKEGKECPFLEACFNKTVQDDVLGSGLYEPRTPHHDLELEIEGDDDGQDA